MTCVRAPRDVRARREPQRRNSAAGELLAQRRRQATTAEATALAHRLRFFALHLRAETADAVWLQGLDRSALPMHAPPPLPRLPGACLSRCIPLPPRPAHARSGPAGSREDSDFQRCVAGVAAKRDEDFFRDTPFSGFSVVDVFKLHHEPLRRKFLAAAQTEAAGGESGDGKEPGEAAAKVKGLFCHISVASVEQVALHGFEVCQLDSVSGVRALAHTRRARTR